MILIGTKPLAVLKRESTWKHSYDRQFVQINALCNVYWNIVKFCTLHTYEGKRTDHLRIDCDTVLTRWPYDCHWCMRYGWYRPFAIDWSKFWFGIHQLQYLMNSCGRCEFPRFFIGHCHWESHCTTQTEDKFLSLGLWMGCNMRVIVNILMTYYQCKLKYNALSPSVIGWDNVRRYIEQSLNTCRYPSVVK